MSSFIHTAVLTSLIFLLPVVSQAQSCTSGFPATTPTARFTDHNDGTVTDSKTGLMWKRCSEGQSWVSGTCTGTSPTYRWQQALQQAQTVNNSGGFAGQTDWRLPNIKELASIVERGCADPSINKIVFPATPSDLFMSSSNCGYDFLEGWAYNFNSHPLSSYDFNVHGALECGGLGYGSSSYGSGRVRLVR